ncbi:MAG: 30S ribosomal protein S12 methylthiotransferase RimO [Candidatus Omnitrophica bacterium]|nr:30S ribosomal protein S12 methylthiotransferase RimO [Candidatus Omnitrophota bacterium]
MKKIYLFSLGCPRNLVDSEVLLALLEKKGYEIAEEPENADVAIVNTCGFIEDAKQESVNTILQLADLKKTSELEKIVVTGCLSQRYPDELLDQIAEIDGIFGTSDFREIPGKIELLYSGERVRAVRDRPEFLYDDTDQRKLITPHHFAYVKIQEGCSNRCTYCIIPELKGPRRSRTMPSVLEEIKYVRDHFGVKEIVLIGQDTTSFGIDRLGKSELAGLIREAAPLMHDGWLRVLYTHPVQFTDELIEVIATTSNVCSYVDLPIQHINDAILRKMNRRVDKRAIVDLIQRIRKKIDSVVLRTSVIVGFPGESEKQFGELMDFLLETRFERMGAFIYSREEGTAAFEYKEQVPEQIKRERFDKVMALQQRISAENNMKFFGKTLDVLIEEKDPSEKDIFFGRSCMDAPEVDGMVYVKGTDLKVGEFRKVRISGTLEYDLIGEAL